MKIQKFRYISNSFSYDMPGTKELEICEKVISAKNDFNLYNLKHTYLVLASRWQECNSDIGTLSGSSGNTSICSRLFHLGPKFFQLKIVKYIWDPDFFKSWKLNIKNLRNSFRSHFISIKKCQYWKFPFLLGEKNLKFSGWKIKGSNIQ